MLSPQANSVSEIARQLRVLTFSSMVKPRLPSIFINVPIRNVKNTIFQLKSNTFQNFVSFSVSLYMVVKLDFIYVLSDLWLLLVLQFLQVTKDYFHPEGRKDISVQKEVCGWLVHLESWGQFHVSQIHYNRKTRGLILWLLSFVCITSSTHCLSRLPL